jgi:hypothetical protein
MRSSAMVRFAADRAVEMNDGMTFIQQAVSPHADRYMEAKASKELEIYLVTRPRPASQSILPANFRKTFMRVSGLDRRQQSIARH